MAIKKARQQSGKESYVYRGLSKDELYEQMTKLLDALSIYLDSGNSKISLSDIKANAKLLSELMIRVDKRKDYFRIFHSGTEINEQKEAALLAYWIVKFRPFSLKESVEPLLAEEYANINEVFAIFIILSVAKKISMGSNNETFSVSSDFLRRLTYAFKYWDMSKESVMLLVEAFCEGI